MKGKWIFGIGLVIVMVAGGLAYAGVTAAPNRNGGTPAQVTANFYDWYLGYIGEGETRQNPLVDGAYRSSEYLAGDFIAEVDAIVTGFDRGGYDPFLMAQDVPTSVTVGEAVIDGDAAYVPVETSFPGHALTVGLMRLDGRWQITSIAPAPEMVVSSFYGWYLWYIDGGEAMRNPLVDGAYRDCGYLTEGFVTEIDQTLASFDNGGYDPLLMAQDVPERVTVVEATAEGAEAQVKVAMFWGNNPAPSERTVNLTLVDGNWKIASVSH